MEIKFHVKFDPVQFFNIQCLLFNLYIKIFLILIINRLFVKKKLSLFYKIIFSVLLKFKRRKKKLSILF